MTARLVRHFIHLSTRPFVRPSIHPTPRCPKPETRRKSCQTTHPHPTPDLAPIMRLACMNSPIFIIHISVPVFLSTSVHVHPSVVLSSLITVLTVCHVSPATASLIFTLVTPIGDTNYPAFSSCYPLCLSLFRPSFPCVSAITILIKITPTCLIVKFDLPNPSVQWSIFPISARLTSPHRNSGCVCMFPTGCGVARNGERTQP